MSQIKMLEDAIWKLHEFEESLLRLRADLISADRLLADNRRLNARCERLENELMSIRDVIHEGGSFELRELRLKDQSDFECLNQNKPKEVA